MISTFIFNLLIVVCEMIVFINIKNKKDIFKYYTYLCNLICLIISVITCIYIVYLYCGGNELFFIRGFRYISCCGVITAMIVYILFLSSNKSNCLSNDDFTEGFNYKVGNFLLHYFCPIISIISFIFIEEWMMLNDGFWTIYAAIPSVLYFIVYSFLSIFKLWDEPYTFKGKHNNSLLEVISFVFIPILFVFISFILWNIK